MEKGCREQVSEQGNLSGGRNQAGRLLAWLVTELWEVARLRLRLERGDTELADVGGWGMREM